jgi:hypothetical protein
MAIRIRARLRLCRRRSKSKIEKLNRESFRGWTYGFRICDSVFAGGLLLADFSFA